MLDSRTSSKVSLSPKLGEKMWVFRDGKRRVKTRDLFEALNQDIRRGASALDVLLRAGELEAGLADVACPAAQVEQLTDAAARAVVNEGPLATEQLKILEQAPETLLIGTPEGFAFYLLHPLSFRELAREVHGGREPAAVVGIRSIGATLSAVVAATIKAERITVRPVGHPYERTVTLNPEQSRWVADRADRQFYVVDEGPGFSGSSLISTCEALERAGISNERIAILCTAEPDPKNLMAGNGASRWQRYRSFKTMPYLPAEIRDEKWYWAEHWRKRIWGDDESLWPGVWRQLETPKFLARDDHRLFRFVGFGHYGTAALDRYDRLAEEGLGPRVKRSVDGFAEFWMEGGSAFRAPHWNEKTQAFVVRYLAQRSRLCPASTGDVEQNLVDLTRMVHFNTEEITGSAYEAKLRVEGPVFADNRMNAYKFMRTPFGLKKLDGAAHGDDHFFPGPCDLAWDIAGTIHEWRLSEPARERLLRDYSSASGDLFIRSRLRDWSIAYLAFRCGYCLMGANANNGWPEGERLMRDARFYAERLVGEINMDRRFVQERIPA
ncbi:MAG: hypothetical protein NVS9B15_01950 [Acidobacteriaceae bacterium]